MKRPIREIADNTILTANQKVVIHEYVRSPLRELFRLSGGTALSAFYLKNRLLQVPVGVDRLLLKIKVRREEIETFFSKEVRKIVEKEIC